MADWSAWINPITNNEKPEIVAPGQSITGIVQQGNFGTVNGTSFAAPQVSGLAALLMHQDLFLSIRPEATRAILMVSARNIDGPTGIPAGQDLKDGAGGINAALAARVGANYRDAQSLCTTSCWWFSQIDNQNFPIGSYLYRPFTAKQGDFVRVVIAWAAQSDCANISGCTTHELDVHLNLGIRDPNGQLVPDAWSATWENSFQLIEFVAPMTGTYQVAVFKQDAPLQDSLNFLGIGLLRLHQVYLPLVIRN